MMKSIPGHKAKKMLSWIRRAPGKAVEAVKKIIGEEKKENSSDLPDEYVMPDSPYPGILPEGSTDSEYEVDYIYRTEAERSMEKIDHHDHGSRSSSMASSRAQKTSRLAASPLISSARLSRYPSIMFVPTLADRSSLPSTSSLSSRYPRSPTPGIAPFSAPSPRFNSAFANRSSFRKNAMVALPAASPNVAQKSSQERNTPLPNFKDEDKPVVP